MFPAVFHPYLLGVFAQVLGFDIGVGGQKGVGCDGG